MSNKTHIGYSLKLTIKREHAPLYDNVSDICEISLDVGESKQGEIFYDITYFMDLDCDREVFNKSLNIATEQAGEQPKFKGDFEKVYDEDWEAVTVASFKPMQLGSFFIHRFDEDAPAGTVSLKVPANMAFGSGEHATTAGCLDIYEKLTSKGYTFENGLDMGCGSAVLAMASAKKDSVNFLGVDIDEPSVVVANQNAIDNSVEDKVKCVSGDGFNTPEVKNRAPFDLIFANILANPLIEMSAGLVDVLAEGGVTIISGFLNSQSEDVLNAYTSKGLNVIESFERDNWCAVALVKK